MKDNNEKVLNDFLGTEEEVVDEKIKNEKKIILDEREGLIERIDRTFVDSKGRQLLREQY